MKHLYLVRHAKSSWGDPSQPDFERPLNERGKRDAPVMAHRLKKRIPTPDLFLSSPAKRAKKTCKIFCEEFHASEKDIQYADKLYLASVQTFYDIISSVDKDVKHLVVFSHNPGITDFANSLCEGVAIANMPTCSIFAVKLKISDWKEIAIAEKEFEFFDYPKLEESL